MWSRVMHFGVICIGPTFFHFCVTLLNLRFVKIIGVAYILAIPLVVLNLTPLLVASVSPKSYFRHYTDPGPGYSLLLLYFFVFTVWGMFMLVRALRTSSSSEKRAQIRYVLVASLIGFLSGSATFFPVFGIDIWPICIFGVSAYTFLVSYAILRHKLLNIDVIVKRTAVFAGLFTFVYGIFSFITITGQNFFSSAMGWNHWMSMIPTVLIITLTLRPFENFLTNATEKFLFQKKYDYRDLLKTFTNEVLTVLDIQQLPAQTVAGLIRILKLESACILLFDRNNRKYSVVSQIGVRETNIVLDEKDVLIEYLKASHQPIQKDKQAERMAHGHLKDTFKKLNAQICLPIPMHDELIGVMSLGMKKSGEEFNQEDIDILMTLARTEAIAISNARLFEELSRTQAEAAQREKMAVIGTLAAGINHEICNPLGIVRGQCELFLLNLRDGYYNNKTSEELLKISGEIMNKVIKETDRATSITKKLSSFAKPSRQTDFEDVYVEKEVEEVLGLIEHDLKLSNIDIQRDFPSGYPVIKADRKQIQEVLFNIIRNAAQAIEKKEGRIVVSGFADHDNAIIRIADNGSGIPKDKVEQIFHPFYTTKAPGKGTGLGLFIVKQVVERNKGAIEVESEEGVGTTFTLRFPTAAKLAAVA